MEEQKEVGKILRYSQQAHVLDYCRNGWWVNGLCKREEQGVGTPIDAQLAVVYRQLSFCCGPCGCHELFISAFLLE
jgi:hypothetical protein